MKSHRWIVLLAVGGLALAACTPSEAPASSGICSSGGRCRAWLLFEADDPIATAGDLEKVMGQGEDAYVVIRADVVNGEYNLVVPVDTASQSDFDSLLATLTKMVGAEPMVLMVDEHHPIQTTRANSYVTESEALGLEGDFPEPGRQVPNSPGANPWG